MTDRTAEVIWDGEAYVVTLRDGGIIYGTQEFPAIATDAGDYMMTWVRHGKIIY